MTTTRRRLRAALALPLLLALLAGLAACADDAEGSDGVATLDEDGSGNDSGDSADSGDGGGAAERGPGDDPEMQDAALEYAECMRDHGVDMPDPEFTDDGGMRISAGSPEGPGSGPDEEEFQAADEACQPILEEVMPDMQLDPEEQAELQDHLVEVAECMRGKGYDMPDPEVDDGGRVTVQRGGPGTEGGPRPGEEDEFEADMEDCGGGPGGFRRAGGGDDDSSDDDSDDGDDAGEGEA